MAHPPKRRVVGGTFAPLVDEDGATFEHVPCQDNPAMWDEDAPRDDKRAAAFLCRPCPALVACWIRRKELGRSASGVWAGRILRDLDEARGAANAEHDDPELAGWAAAAGVTIRSTPTRKATAP